MVHKCIKYTFYPKMLWYWSPILRLKSNKSNALIFLPKYVRWMWLGYSKWLMAFIVRPMNQSFFACLFLHHLFPLGVLESLNFITPWSGYVFCRETPKTCTISLWTNIHITLLKIFCSSILCFYYLDCVHCMVHHWGFRVMIPWLNNKIILLQFGLRTQVYYLFI